jgi:phosphoribosylaminoimidazole-succinocarboxamide synthase
MQERFTSRVLNVLREPAAGQPGIGEFHFTDHYSIYDLGKMPDQLPGKGEATCRIATRNFRELAARGIPTHFLGSPADDRMQFQLLRIIFPQWEAIRHGTLGYFVPLQVVFRNRLPAGASVFRRLANGTITPADLGLDAPPQPGMPLRRPLIEYMTKLDEMDEYIPRAAARELAGLTEAQMQRLETLTLAANEVLAQLAREAGLCLADGKLEFGVDGRGDLMLVDVAGAPDDTRYLLGECHISKQVLRDCYEHTGLRQQVLQWAARGRLPGSRPSPPSLGPVRIGIVADMYKSLCERWVQSRIWGAPDLQTVMHRLATLPPLEGRSSDA